MRLKLITILVATLFASSTFAYVRCHYSKLGSNTSIFLNNTGDPHKVEYKYGSNNHDVTEKIYENIMLKHGRSNMKELKFLKVLGGACKIKDATNYVGGNILDLRTSLPSASNITDSYYTNLASNNKFYCLQVPISNVLLVRDHRNTKADELYLNFYSGSTLVLTDHIKHKHKKYYAPDLYTTATNSVPWDKIKVTNKSGNQKCSLDLDSSTNYGKGYILDLVHSGSSGGSGTY